MQRISITNPQNIIDGTAKKYYFKLRNTGGPKGDKGDKGDTGATGPQGPQGDPCTVVVNSTATLEPGSNAYVTNTGSLSNAVLNFGIPKGDRGPQGAKGDKGDTGAQGETGPRGPQGERGTNATVSVGTTSTLNPGSQATVYNSGSDSSAVLNFGIPQGAKGDTGSQGPQGPQGPTGPAGQNFAATVVTELPETGDSSKLYLTPKAHTTSTATGNPVTASVTEQAGALESFQLDGDTYQQSYTGKNLWSATTLVNGYYKFADGDFATGNSNYVTNIEKIDVTAGESYHISADKGAGVAGSGCVFFNNDTFVSSSVNPSGNNFTVPEGANKMAFNFFNSTGLSPSEVTHIQLEAGSTGSSYEPYVGGVPSPNPDYPQPIQTVTGEQTVEIVGKNLFDETATPWGEKVAFNDAGEQVRWTGYVGIADYQPVVPNTTYAFSNSLGKAIYYGLVFYDADKNNISFVTASTRTFTTPANCAYIRFAIQSSTAPTWTQLELGSTASAYTQYTSTSYPLDLGSIELCKLDDYQDYIYKDGENWKVHKATAMQTIISGNVRAWSSYTNIEYATYSKSEDYDGFNTWDGKDVLCDHATFARGSGLAWLDNASRVGNIIANASVSNYWIGFVKGTPLETMKSKLNGSKILYPLATPTDTTITDQTLIAQLEAIRTASLQASNTITNMATGSNLAGDMEIGYYGYNPRNRYDEWLWLDINNEYEQIGS